jgi:hypothetical protein
MKFINGYEHLYKISENGDIFSCRTNKIMKPYLHKSGYMIIKLENLGRRKNYYIHRLVALTYIPTKDKSLDINHKDNNTLNNHVSNLEWVTRKENNDIAIAAGRNKKRGKSLVGKQDWQDIVDLFKEGISCTKIAEKYNCSTATISRIVKRMGGVVNR